MRTLLRFFFRLLYHPFAFTYDLVAATVSFGRWKDWIMEVLPFIEGTRILEIGHGPGHLQRVLLSRNLVAFGLDESAPMGNLASARLRKSGHKDINLVRGLSQNLPFPGERFDTIVSTFPSEYIFNPHTLAEAKRCLLNGGRLVVLPVAWHTGKRIMERYAAWLFRVTGESPQLEDAFFEKIITPFEKAGFQVEIENVEVKSSLLLIVIAKK